MLDMFSSPTRRTPWYTVVTAAALLLFTGGCDLDVVNPNNPSEEQVLTTTEGVEALAVGMQEFYATSTLEPVLLTTGTTSREVAVNNTFANLVNLEAGGTALPPSNANVLQLWSRNYRVVQMAEDIIATTPNLPFQEGTESGLIATAHLFKAMALGNIAQNFEQGTLTTDREEDVQFAPRQELFDEAITLLDDALTLIETTPPSDAFTNNILASGLDLSNLIQAYRARYNLFAGNFAQAQTAAAAVDQSSTSTFSYDDQSRNPVWDNVFREPNYAPREGFGAMATDPEDARLPFFMMPSDETSSPNDLPIDDLAGFFGDASTAIPLYVPGEMDLIRAEAIVRSGGNLDAAVDAIDAVRTKAPDDDPLGLGADLDPYTGAVTQDALLDEILQQRRAELYLQGVALEDMRRLGPADPDPDDIFARSRNFYPYPQQERQNNPNTPANPGI